MEIFVESIIGAFRLFLTRDSGIWQIILVTLYVAFFATAGGFIIGTPLGFIMGTSRFRGRGFLLTLTNTGMAIPPVVIGLFVMMMLSRRGPLGFLNLLYSVDAMIIAQILISTPIIAGLTAAAVGAVPPRLRLQARSLGASGLQEAFLVIREARLGVIAAVAGGLGAVIRGVGAVMMVGGNIEGKTQVLTTAIVQESRMGNFANAFALCIVLMFLAFSINGIISWYQHSWPKT